MYYIILAYPIKCFSTFVPSFPLQCWTDITTLSTSTTADSSSCYVKMLQRLRTTNRPSFTGSWTRSAANFTKYTDLSRLTGCVSSTVDFLGQHVRCWGLLQNVTFTDSRSILFYCLLCVQVCDKEWHHYVLNVEFPTMSLFVDGTTFEPFLVTEDYPLHASRISTQLTIGACWQGELSQMIYIRLQQNSSVQD